MDEHEEAKLVVSECRTDGAHDFRIVQVSGRLAGEVLVYCTRCLARGVLRVETLG